jgi:hypothetical protein
MPQLQVVDTTRNEAGVHPVQENLQTFFSKMGKDYRDKEDRVQIGNLINEYKQNREDANAWEDLQLGLEQSNISPTKRLQTQQSLNEMKKIITEKDKALNAQVKKGMLTAEERARQKENLIATGYSDEEAEVYLDAPPSVKNTLERAVRERTIREQGNPQAAPQTMEEVGAIPSQIGIPQAKGVGAALTTLPKAPSIEEWPTLETPLNMTPAEKVKWENNNEKENNKELKESQSKKKVYRDNGLLIKSMTNTNDSGKLPSGLSNLIIDPKTGDISGEAQLAGLVNPETQLYVKNLKQFLKGAKEFFGARVTNFDVKSFMAQLPTLLNSDQGRRLILKQMEYVNDLEQVHNTTLNEGLKKYGRKANYGQIVKAVDDKVAVKEQDLLYKIDNVVEASKFLNILAENPEKFKGTVVMQDPEGKFKAVPQDKVAKFKAKQWKEF